MVFFNKKFRFYSKNYYYFFFFKFLTLLNNPLSVSLMGQGHPSFNPLLLRRRDEGWDGDKNAASRAGSRSGSDPEYNSTAQKHCRQIMKD
ncbi:hypothetical protein XELAEV_18024030mg [Xenopus laevis]|uniref:Uncharacterized protein n=1 Tax=Xenopus laevis TaxID=8355 RepID=A0A974HQ64_XENLA|nr:hypothetical protein XELAEV_18024030mg [Xenopus laevis]